ncbi:MAG: hypothetical protein KGD57_04700 [Candidatus Lokiarchaeota archaeon]|nr:hypothetical protein [Candidatus Lokiarchaeota archaeon]
MKKLLISAIPEGDLISEIIKLLENSENIELEVHNPLKNPILLKEIKKDINDYDLIIVKGGSASSIKLLYIAKINNIPTINQYDAVLLCKNKIILDSSLRQIFQKYKNELNNFYLPNSWAHPNPLKNPNIFKKWASSRLPLVFKSHDMLNEKRRYNFLAKEPYEIDGFLVMYKDSLYNDLYIQEFIKCDGIDRKIYVVGDKIFGIERDNPIYIYLREKSENIDIDNLERKPFQIDNEIRKLANIISKELNLGIYGFDLLKSVDDDKYYLIDLNDFPGLKGVQNKERIIVDYILEYLNHI